MQFNHSSRFSGEADPPLDVIDPKYTAFVYLVGAGVDVDYVIISERGNQWEVGTGQLSVGGVLTRDTVTSNSLGTTAKIDFDLGSHVVVVSAQSGGGGATITVKEGGSTVSSSVTTIDFGSGFDVSESPAGEANVSLDLSEVTIDADTIVYDNTSSGLAATDVQAAIDEIKDDVWYTARKTANTARNSTTTLAADPDLTIPIAANEKMVIEGKIFFDSAAAPDFKFNVQGPSSPSYVCIYGTYFSGSDANGNLATLFKYSTLGFTAISLGTGAAGVNAFLEFSLVIHNGANSGNVAFWWAQNLSDASSTTVRAGSYMRGLLVA